jgi:hypothetical protein
MKKRKLPDYGTAKPGVYPTTSLAYYHRWNGGMFHRHDWDADFDEGYYWQHEDEALDFLVRCVRLPAGHNWYRCGTRIAVLTPLAELFHPWQWQKLTPWTGVRVPPPPTKPEWQPPKLPGLKINGKITL